MSWSGGIARVKSEVAGSIRGKREMTSRGSTRPLMNCSWAFPRSICLKEMKAARQRTRFTVSAQDSLTLLQPREATDSAMSRASSTRSLSSKNYSKSPEDVCQKCNLQMHLLPFGSEGRWAWVGRRRLMRPPIFSHRSGQRPRRHWSRVSACAFDPECCARRAEKMLVSLSCQWHVLFIFQLTQLQTCKNCLVSWLTAFFSLSLTKKKSFSKVHPPAEKIGLLSRFLRKMGLALRTISLPILS